MLFAYVEVYGLFGKSYGMMKGKCMAEKIIKKCLIFALIVVMVSYQGNVGVVLASAVIHEKITDLDRKSVV